MKVFLQFLILQLKSIDGLRNSAVPYIEGLVKHQILNSINKKQFYLCNDFEIETLYRYYMEVLSE